MGGRSLARRRRRMERRVYISLPHNNFSFPPEPGAGASPPRLPLSGAGNVTRHFLKQRAFFKKIVPRAKVNF